MSDPYRTTESDTRVRIAVVIDVDGRYSAFGDSELRHASPREQDDHLVREAVQHYENVVGSHDLRHVQFLEITLPTPSTRPVNLEAREGAEPLPAVALGGRFVLPEQSE